MTDGNEYEVIVVGAGPVGLMLACELQLAGVRVLVLEKLFAPSGHDRAGALHVRTVEGLEIRGLLDAFLAGTDTLGGLPMAGMFHRGLDFSLLDTRHPFSALVPQSRTEALLTEHARALGVEIRRGREVVGLTQRDDYVEVDVDESGRRRRMRGRYLVGCDGGRGRIRRLAGIPFEGMDASVSALVGYVTLPLKNVPRRWQRLAGGILVLSFPPEGGIGRVVVMEYDRPNVDRDAPATLDELTAAVTRVRGEPLPLGEPVDWLSRFSDVSRQATQYRRGRVFLAGDAAHVHFPIGGQGLNLGLQDALNLGWKLAGAVRGWAPDGLLDSYHDERHPVGERVLINTRAQLALMRPDDHHVTPLRQIIDELLVFDNVNRFFGDMITGTGVRYVPPDAVDDGSLGARWLGRFAGNLMLVDERGFETPVAALLQRGRGQLLDVADWPELRAVARPWADRIDVVSGRVKDESVLSALLVRPDGYVAWAAGGESDPRPGLSAALRRFWGEPRAVG